MRVPEAQEKDTTEAERGETERGITLRGRKDRTGPEEEEQDWLDDDESQSGLGSWLVQVPACQ